MTPDGSVIVGRAAGEDQNNTAFRWEGGVMEDLGRLEGEGVTGSQAWGVSGDGSVVFGSSRILHEGGHPVRWVDGEIEDLWEPCPVPSAEEGAYTVKGASPNGIIVSDCAYDGNPSFAVRWVDGEWEALMGDAQGSYVHGVSSDGSTIVGNVSNEGVFRWTEEGGVEIVIPTIVDGVQGLSADGSTLVGSELATFPDVHAWRWTEGVGKESLGHLPDGFNNVGLDASADGSVVVGRETVGEFGGDTILKAFIWTEENGIRDLKEVLEGDFGLDLTGWELESGIAISHDGTVIVGSGFNPDGDFEGWRAEAPFGQPVADEATPEALADVLSAPSPNPVRGTSTFTVAVERGQHVAVEVFDALGRQVQTVYNGTLAAGMSERLTLDASALPAGVYVVRATGEDFAKTRNITVVK